MRRNERYDQGYGGYGRPGEERGLRGYGGDYRRGYDRGFEAAPRYPVGPGHMPMTWGWYGPFGVDVGPFPYGPPPGPGYAAYERPPRRPEESPAYGRGGDRELRRWARERGYDVGHAIYPRDARRHR